MLRFQISVNFCKAKIFLGFGKNFSHCYNFAFIFSYFFKFSKILPHLKHILALSTCGQKCNVSVQSAITISSWQYSNESPCKKYFLSNSVQALGGKYATKSIWISPEMGTSFFNNMLSQTTSIKKRLLKWKYVSTLVRNQHLSLIK